MGFYIDRHEEGKVLVITIPADFKIKSQLPALLAETGAALDESPEPVFVVALMQAPVIAFHEIVWALTAIGDSDPALTQGLNLAMVLVVAPKTIQWMAFEALARTRLRDYPVERYDTLDDALQVIRSALQRDAAD